MQVLGLKTDKFQGMNDEKQMTIAYFLTNTFARMARELE